MSRHAVLGLRLRLAVVMDSVTVRRWAGVAVIPAEHLAIAWSVLGDGGDRGGLMAAGCPDSEPLLRGGL